MALRTFTSAGVNNLWSNALNWNTGVPVDTDTFALSAGSTCEFDADHTGWAGLGASTIASGTTLIATTTAGAYVLKMNGDLTVNGTLQAGTSVAVPYPSTCTFTIDLASASNSIVMADATGNIQFFCVEPVVKYIKLTAQEATAQTVLSVDTDVSGDPVWAAGATVFIADSSVALDRETIAIASTAATTITVAAPGLAAQKEIGTVIALITRNIRIINTTDYAVKEGFTVASHVDAEFNDVIGAFSSTIDAVVGGSVLTTSTSDTNGVGIACSQMTFSGVCCNSSVSGIHYGVSGALGGNFTSECLFAGQRNYAMIGGISYVFSGLSQNCTRGIVSAKSFSCNGDIVGSVYGISVCSNFWFTGIMTNISERCFDICSNFSVGNAELSDTIGGGAVAVYDIYRATSARFFNTLFQGTTEFVDYLSFNARSQWDYVESSNHDLVNNAYKAWILGGIVASQTASPPSGYTIWYQLQCESATYPCFRHYQTVVLPGTAIEVTGLMRINDAADHTAYPPRLQIIDAFADPLVDSTQSPLDESQMADPDGSDNSWQAVSVIWANQGDSPRTVLVRMIAKHATGDVDTVWAVADYQDQINTIYKKVKRLAATSEA